MLVSVIEAIFSGISILLGLIVLLMYRKVRKEKSESYRNPCTSRAKLTMQTRCS